MPACRLRNEQRTGAKDPEDERQDRLLPQYDRTLGSQRTSYGSARGHEMPSNGNEAPNCAGQAADERVCDGLSVNRSGPGKAVDDDRRRITAAAVNCREVQRKQRDHGGATVALLTLSADAAESPVPELIKFLSNFWWSEA